jgi:cephalosporin hydroxylase
MISRNLKEMRKVGIWAFSKNTLSGVYESYLSVILMPFVVRKFKAMKKRVDNINDAVELAFEFRFFGISIRPAQLENEISKLMAILAEFKPKCVIEIGIARGGTLFLWSKVATSEAIIIGLDLNMKHRLPLFKSFKEDRQESHLLSANSHAEATLQNVKQIIGEKKVDFLFIDGDHTYEGIKKDFEMYSNLVVKGGIIALHDICLHPSDTVCEVEKFWNEIKSNYRFEEIIKDKHQGWAGIGILYF